MRSPLSYRLLGMLEVRTDDAVVPLPQGKLRALLAALLLSANRYVGHAELAERLWGADLPTDPRATLATYVLRLRRILGVDAAGRSPIRAHGQGYLIDVEPEHLDLLRFEQLVEASRRTDDPETELRLLTDALRLCRGTPLADVDSASLQADHTPRLEEQRLRVVERRIDLELANGNHAELVGELTSLTREHPLRQRFCAQSMLALYRCGRQADALAAYSELRSRLVGELGLEPSADLRRLQEQILAEDDALDLEPFALSTPTGWTTLCQLPAGVENLVGRTGRLTAAWQHLEGAEQRVPTVVVTGPAGVGKTAFAVELAHRLRHRYPDAQLFVPMRSSERSPRAVADVLAELLTAAGVPTASIPDGADARSAALRARLADRRVLVVVDDVDTAGDVLALLPGTAGSALIVTSRFALGGVPATHTVRLPPLGPDDGFELLARLLGSGRAAAEPEAARAIVAAAGAHPSALVAVAARLNLRPVVGLDRFAAVLADPARRLDQLAGGDVDVRTGLDRTYSTLDPQAAAAYRRLGPMAGLAVPSWAVGVLTGRHDPDRAIEQLVDANVLTDAGLDPLGEPRYRMDALAALHGAELGSAEDVAAILRFVHALLDLATEPTAEEAAIDWALAWCVEHGRTVEAAKLREIGAVARARANPAA
jgi:DNA-binding SARP family transcriptional activator